MESARVLKAKVCLIGEAAVGKTSLIRRYVEDVFDDRYISTLGSKVTLKRIRLAAEVGEPQTEFVVQLSIWDLIGERSYLDTLHREYLKGALALIAVCDTTRYTTFEALDEWLGAATKVTGPVPVVLVVNKADLKDRVICLYEDGEPDQKARQYGGSALWASAKSGENVNPAFESISRALVRRHLAARKADAYRTSG